MARTRRNRRSAANGRSIPQIHLGEELNVATADSVQTLTIYNPQVGTAALEIPTRFTLRNCTVTVIPGGTATNKIFVVIRRVPNGYSFPTITPASGVTAFGDISNLLGYAILDGQDTVPAKLTKVHPSVIVYPGDTICLQAVSNVSSTNATVSTMTDFWLSAL